MEAEWPFVYYCPLQGVGYIRFRVDLGRVFGNIPNIDGFAVFVLSGVA